MEYDLFEFVEHLFLLDLYKQVKMKVIVAYVLDDYTMGVVVQIQLRVHANDIVVDRRKYVEIEIHMTNL